MLMKCISMKYFSLKILWVSEIWKHVLLIVCDYSYLSKWLKSSNWSVLSMWTCIFVSAIAILGIYYIQN